METIKIDILNPKAINIIRDLAAVDLIRINKSKTPSNFSNILSRLRKNSDDVPSLDDITREVESIR
ncbi:MAG: hypothetical protein PF693_02855 [Spirochaetia bacterium]|jgi:hypothetical protein|nr:hypothetical protein [Spirochaetia bacterium]